MEPEPPEDFTGSLLDPPLLAEARTDVQRLSTVTRAHLVGPWVKEPWFAEPVGLLVVLLAAVRVLTFRLLGPEAKLSVTSRSRSFAVDPPVQHVEAVQQPEGEELLLGMHSDLPFTALVERMAQEGQRLGLTDRWAGLWELKGDEEAQPLFQAIMSVHDQAASTFDETVERGETGEHAGPAGIRACGMNADLVDGEISVGGWFNPMVLPEEVGDLLLARLETLLTAIRLEPHVAIGRLPLIRAEERHQALFEWNDKTTPYPRDECIHEIFERQASVRPNDLALIGEEWLTYRQLNQRADALAVHLLALGLNREGLVGVVLPRSAGAVVAMLATLKAGGAYLPLDPDYPEERLANMLRSAQPEVIVSQRDLVGRIGRYARHVVVLEEWSADSRVDTSQVGRRSSPEELAYVMFTSGSTGAPKGVEVPHRAVVRLVANTDYIEFGVNEVFLHAAPLTFDASTFEIWGALLNGARLVIAPHGPPSLEVLQVLISRHSVTTSWLPAALFDLVVQKRIELLEPLNQIITGGDIVPLAAARRVLQAFPEIRLVNGYGPTECATFTCCHRIHLQDTGASSIPIGRSIANSHVYVLDPYLEPLPPGVPGEIFIGGDGLARGYLRLPHLTRERFVEHDFGDGLTRRLYRTGDIGRYRLDGTIIFLGRHDRQIKIRGYRVEPAEVDAALTTNTKVLQAVTVAAGVPPSGRRLVSYFVPSSRPGPTQVELRQHLERLLPRHMLPAILVQLDSLPVTENGKVDLAALPDPNPVARSSPTVAGNPGDQIQS
jgi:amino acid adenylation domain-containing protein